MEAVREARTPNASSRLFSCTECTRVLCCSWTKLAITSLKNRNVHFPFKSTKVEVGTSTRQAVWLAIVYGQYKAEKFSHSLLQCCLRTLYIWLLQLIQHFSVSLVCLSVSKVSGSVTLLNVKVALGTDCRLSWTQTTDSSLGTGVGAIVWRMTHGLTHDAWPDAWLRLCSAGAAVPVCGLNIWFLAVSRCVSTRPLLFSRVMETSSSLAVIVCVLSLAARSCSEEVITCSGNVRSESPLDYSQLEVTTCIRSSLISCACDHRSMMWLTHITCMYVIITTQVHLLTRSGTLKEQTDCAPNNGYFLIPIYDKVRCTQYKASERSLLLLVYSQKLNAPPLTGWVRTEGCATSRMELWWAILVHVH